MKGKDLYTQLNEGSDKPESVILRGEGGGGNDKGVNAPTPTVSTSTTPMGGPATSKVIYSLAGGVPGGEGTLTRTRSYKRYKHKRSKSHENYSKIVSPRHASTSPCVDYHSQAYHLPHSLSFRQSPNSCGGGGGGGSVQLKSCETQTEETSFEGGEGQGHSNVCSPRGDGGGGGGISRQLHLNIPSSPSASYLQGSQGMGSGDGDKVTDMSLGSEASSSNKTPGGGGGGYGGNGGEGYHRKPFGAQSTLEEEEEEKKIGGMGTGHGQAPTLVRLVGLVEKKHGSLSYWLVD